MGRPRVEQAVDRFLPLYRCGCDGRLAHLPDERRSLAPVCRRGCAIMDIVLVAAIGENNVIGLEGQLPWHLRSDLAHFRALTINKPVVMGRRTYTSIGKPLKDRTNIVITRDLSLLAPPGVVLATTIEAAISTAFADAQKRGVREIMIIGGSDIFNAMM